MDILTDLNPAQLEAVEAPDGPLLILAGPGSGKTRVITHRIAYLIKVRGVRPYRIMAVTFTNKAAREMTARLGQLVSAALPEITMGTFHAICARILRRDGQAIGIEPRFVIYDDQDQTSLIKRTLQALNIDPKKYAPASIANAISAAKTQTWTPAEYAQRSRSYFDEIGGRTSPDAKVVFREQTYRSTQKILETASYVISANKQRKPTKLWTQNETGEPANLVETYTEQEEAQFVISEIERLVERGEASLADCAVMYRTNAQSRAIEEAFVRYGTPYKLVAGTRFYERREVKDIVAYLRLIQNPNDSVSLSRIINVPGRGIGQATLDELARWASSQGVTDYH